MKRDEFTVKRRASRVPGYDYELQVQSYGLQVQSYGFRVTVTGSELQVQSYGLQG